MKKILLTAFEPFGGKPINPTLEIVRAIRLWPLVEAEIRILELPVACFTAVELTIRDIEEFKPDIVIMLGEAGGRASINPERVAINRDDFATADNSGYQLQNQPIIEGGPVGYFSTLPINEIVNHLRQAHIPAKISNTAGLFVCNRLFYSVMHFIVVQQLPIMAGFIHVPFLPQQAVDEHVNALWLPYDDMLQGIQIAIKVCIQLVQAP